MLHRHPLFTDDAPPAGGDAAVADAPTKPLTPIAGGIPSGGQQQQTPTPQPGDFDWKQPVPKGAPPIFAKYKTFEEVGKAHASLQTELEKAKKAAKNGVPNDKWNGWLGQYFQDGALPEDVFTEIQNATGLPPELSAGMFEHMKAKRESFVSKADEAIADLGVSYAAIEQWMVQSGQYPAEALAGFMYLANRGDASWVPQIANDYVTANPDAIVPQSQSGVPANKKAPPRAGKPAGATGPTHNGFNTRAESDAALAAARASGDGMAMNEWVKKMAATPDKVRASWGRR